jgi:hypothetical protein
MKKFILSLIACCVVMPCFAKDDRVVYQYKQGNGVILTNRPLLSSTPVKATKYVPAVETINVPAKDVYKRGWCKIGTSLVPCYNYQNTVAAHSYKEQGSKAVQLTSKQIQENIDKYNQEQQEIVQQKLKEDAKPTEVQKNIPQNLEQPLVNNTQQYKYDNDMSSVPH